MKQRTAHRHRADVTGAHAVPSWPGPIARVERVHGSPTLTVEGRPVPGMWFTLSGYDANPEYVRGLGAAGVRVFFVCHQLPWYDPAGNERLEREVQTILDAVPDAWIILRTGLYPPDAWFDANPSELIQFADGTPAETWFGKGTRIQCLSSRAWREDQTRELGTFIDDLNSSHYMGNWSLTDLGARLRGWELHRIGAPVACHYLDDLLRADMPDYKLCVFVNAFVLDDRRRDGVRRYLARTPRTALWLYAPGLIHPERAPRLSADHVATLTGIRADLGDAPSLPYCRSRRRAPAACRMSGPTGTTAGSRTARASARARPGRTRRGWPSSRCCARTWPATTRRPRC